MRARIHLVLATIIFLTALTAVAGDTRKELKVELKFVPQEAVDSSSADVTPSMLERSVSIEVEDGRSTEAAAAIGQGTNDDDETFPIRASTDVVKYVGDTATQVAKGWGLKLEEPADRTLKLRLARFFVEESNKAVGSVYAAEVGLTWVLTDRAGKRLDEGAASGSAHRYGRARSGENCSEVLSDSLKEALANVLSDPELQAAWSSGKASAGTSAGASDSGTVEERLKKLEELRKKGLITEEEYKKKRAEILKEL